MSSNEPQNQGPTWKPDPAKGGAALLDYSIIGRYWSKAKPSIMGPYMMNGFGFPASAGSYRFDAECKVVAVESSVPLYEAMRGRCRQYANATLVNDDVLAFQPESSYSLIFLGGILMYLNEGDIVALLERVTSFLEPGGIVLCRESTVRRGTLTRQGDYQVAYRSVQIYSNLFRQCGLSVDQVELNTPYFLMQMGCEFIKKWKARVPESIQAVPLVGGLIYGALRMGGARLTRLPDAMGIDFPELTNHFFLLRDDSDARPRSALSS